MLENRRRLWCDEGGLVAAAERVKAFAAAGLAAQARMRAAGKDPSHTAEARRRQAATAARRRAEEAAWTGPPGDPEEFRREILPRLRCVPLSRIAAATGLSTSYVHEIRQGLMVPHPRWWPALTALVS